MNPRKRQTLPPLREAAVAERILQDVCSEFGVHINTLTNSRRRTANVAEARHTAVFLVRLHTSLLRRHIAAVFDRCEGDIGHNLRRAIKMRSGSPIVAARVTKLSARAQGHRQAVYKLLEAA